MRTHYDGVIDWVSTHAPAVASMFRVVELPVALAADWNVRVMVTWLQDPVDLRAPIEFVLVEGLSRYFDARGIQTINRAKLLSNALKSRALPLIAQAGFRTPQIVGIADPARFRRDFGGLTTPFFVRDDHLHGAPVRLARTEDEAHALRIEDFASPVGVEYIETASPEDGLYRKYRYFGCRSQGIAHHLQTSANWIVRGEGRLYTDRSRDEECAYIDGPDPHHARFQSAMKALGFDMAAFDYSLTPDGDVVVWEVNPFPHIVFPESAGLYRIPAIHHTVAAMIRMYLEAAGLRVPDSILRHIRY